MFYFKMQLKLFLNVLVILCVNKVSSFPAEDSTKCNCILLEKCDVFQTYIHKSTDIDLIKLGIERSICKFDGLSIYICCPKKHYQKRHAKEKTKLDYLDELTGLNCPPSFGKEYNYDEYLKEHDVEDQSDDDVLCDHWGNCGRVQFPKDDGHRYPKPPLAYPTYHHGHNYDFNIPEFPYPHYHHHHHHNHGYDAHYPTEFFTPSPENKQPKECGTLSKSNSYATSSEVYPWIARLAYLNTTSRTVRHRCLGTIISDQHVLTAAHCVDKLVKDLRIIFARVGDDSNFEDFKIIETLVHPNFNEPLFNNDVAILKLAKTHNARVPLTKICLPPNDSKFLMGSTGIVAAWSESGISNVASTSIRYINLPISNNTECAIRYAKYSENFETSIIITPREFCAQAVAMNDVCEGDSGGPFMVRSPSGCFTLLGIVAFGPKTNCGQSNLPGVYMRVSSFVEWIQQNII